MGTKLEKRKRDRNDLLADFAQVERRLRDISKNEYVIQENDENLLKAAVCFLLGSLVLRQIEIADLEAQHSLPDAEKPKL